MANTRFKNILALGAVSSNTSRLLPEIRNFDEIIVVVHVTALGGSPTTATLDLDVETEIEVVSGTRRWMRIFTEALGTVSDADGSPTHTPGSRAFGAFTQLTQTTVLEWIEARGLSTLQGKQIRLTLRPVFTGGASPSWTVGVSTYLKANAG